MYFDLSHEQKMLRDSVHRFMSQCCKPEHVSKLDREARYPYEIYAGWVELGLLGRGIPAEYGGYGGSIEDLALISEDLAYWSYDISTAFTVPLFTGMTLLKWGSENQRRTFLPRLVDGSMRLSVCISEPSAGSDVNGITTRAERCGQGWKLNGQKLWITAASAQDTMLLVYARSDTRAPARTGLSVFLVENDAPGVHIRKLDTLGRRSVGTHEIFFEDVSIDGDRMLGACGKGWDILLSGLQTERALTAAGYAGSCQRVVDIARNYASERIQFNRSIGDFQVIGHMLADMQTQTDAARLLAYQAAGRLSRNLDSLRDVAAAKLFGSEAYATIANMGMQIMGAYGYSMEYEMQRHLRDARSTTIGAGSSQIQRNLIASTMGFKQR